MGLDMYLYGQKSGQYSKNPATEDGFPLSFKTLDLGYWRKHPNLHGYIVDTFADGKDECQRIFLVEDDLQKIIEALENDAIYGEPVTGFFFGRSYFPGEKDEYSSYDEQKQNDLKTFKAALEWKKGALPASGRFQDNTWVSPEWRDVYYEASW